MARCDYANARLGAMRARLLGRAGLRELLSRPSLQERIDLLRASAYGPAIPPPGAADPLAAAERGLGEIPWREARRISGLVEGERPRRLLAAFLALDEAEGLKTVFRGLARSEPADRIQALAAGLGEGTLRALASAASPAAALDLLSRAGSPFAAPIAAALPGLPRPDGPLRLEVALDRAAFALAQGEARGSGEDRAVLGRLLALRADLANAATLLKLGGGAEPDDLFLPGGARLAEARFRALARLDPGELAAALAALLPGLVPSGEGAAALAGPFGADQLLARALERAARREARQRPLSLAVPLAFLIALRAEVGRIRLVLRGAEFGLPADDLVGFVEG